MSDLQTMSEEGRLAFYFWPLLLIRKKRELQLKLQQADFLDKTAEPSMAAFESDEAFMLLKGLNFPLPADLSELPKVDDSLLHGIRYFLRTGVAFEDAQELVLDFVRQNPNGKYERRELLRMECNFSEYLEQAAEKFNEALELQPHQLVYRAALLWASFHDADIKSWQAIASSFIEAEHSFKLINLLEPPSSKPQYAAGQIQSEDKLIPFKPETRSPFNFGKVRSSLMTQQGGLNDENTG